jgi:two-component system, NtrC family, sensor kinase
MRLYTKIALTLAVTGIVCTLASVLAVAAIVVPQYLEMDRSAALTNAGRVYEFLQSEMDTAASYARDWGHWDDTFEFAKKQNKAFIEKNLKQEDLETIKVDEFVIAGANGVVAFEHKANPAADAPPVPFTGAKTIPQAHWTDTSRFTERESRAAVALTRTGPAIVSLTGITDSNGKGPSPGTLLFVRNMDETFLTAVREKTRLDFALTPATKATPAPEDADNATIGKTNETPVLLINRDDTIEARIILTDVSGAPSYALSVTTPTRFWSMGRAAMWSTLGLLLLIGAAAGLSVAAFMRRVITGPLEKIIAHTKLISSTGNLDKGLHLNRSDEIGMLADAFDAMLDDVRRARSALQEQSFVSGMANIAAEMLHNIRNTLSPVAAAIWKGRESLKDLKTDRLVQAGEALANTAVEAEKKAKLAEYVSASARHISERCKSAEAEFETINGFAHQIELVLKHHEELSRGVRVVEDVDLADVADKAANLARQSQQPPIVVVITPAVATLPAVSAERVVLLQVLGNLVINAVQAIERAGVARGQITIDARHAGDDVELTVADNGAGIAPEHMPMLFQRGFTLRPGVGSGLGLHYCATSLGAAGGSIKAESAGENQGATFRLRLPAAIQKEKAA